MKFFAAIAFLAALCLPPALAAQERAADERAAIEAAEGWINQIRTFSADFLQTSSTGGVAQGTLLIKRPGQMLIDYAPPAQLDVFADGRWLIYVDHELKEVNQLPLAATPARVLLTENVRLSDEADIKVRLSKGGIRLFLSRKDNPEDGRITLVFSKSPLALRSWSVVDPQGIETSITLLNSKVNKPIDEKKIVYAPPDWAFQ